MSGQGYIDPDYVDVAERIRLFYAEYPGGRLASCEHGVIHLGDRDFVYVVAKAYRAPDDARPATGRAWEPIPGPTPFTRDSELMNAETAAWGRAIIAAGIPSKKIASSQEVQARRSSPTAELDHKVAQARAQEAPVGLPVDNKQHARIGILVKDLDDLTGEGADWVTWSRNWCFDRFGKRSRAELTHDEAEQLIAALVEQKKMAEVPFS